MGNLHTKQETQCFSVASNVHACVCVCMKCAMHKLAPRREYIHGLFNETMYGSDGPPCTHVE